MTHFLEDILRQPVELQRTIDYLQGAGRRRLTIEAQCVSAGAKIDRITPRKRGDAAEEN